MNKDQKSYTLSFGVILIIAFICWQFLNLSGFCYAEARYIPHSQLIERYLVSEGWSQVSNAKKQEKIAGAKADPNCCIVNRKPMTLSIWDLVVHSIFFNNTYLEIESYLPRKDLSSDPGYPYYRKYATVDVCTAKIIDKYGMTIKKSEYQSNIERISQHK